MDISPLLISIKTAIPSVICAFFLGVFAARGVFSMNSGRARSVIDALLTLPLVLPPTAAGFFLLYIFGAKRPVGQFLIEYLGIKIAFSWSATVLASVLISFPLMYRSAKAAFEQVNPSLIAAAKTLGMSEGRIFWRVIMPLSLPGLTSGGILSFARGLGEFGATVMIAGNIAGKTRTLPLAIYSEVASGDMESAAIYVATIILIAFLAVLGMNAFTERKREYLY